MPSILTKRYQCLLGSACLVSTAAWKTIKNVGVPKDLQAETLKDFVHNLDWKELLQVVCCLTVGGVLFDLFTMNPADSIGYIAMLRQYAVCKLSAVVFSNGRKRLEHNTKNVQSCQEKLLVEILKGARGTQYANDKGFESVRSVEDFRQFHPLTDYSDFKPYIDRIVLGEEKILFNAKVDYIAATTGTTSGKSKLFPLAISQIYNLIRRENIVFAWEITQMPRVNNMRPRIDVSVKFGKTKTETGIPIGPLSGISDRTPINSVMPKIAFQISNLSSALYVQLLFSLQVKDVNSIDGPFASHILSLFETLEERWDDLCFDIQMGRVSEQVDLPDGIRRELNRALKPNRTLAVNLRREFQRGFKNIAQRLWPECAIVVCVTSGPFQTYADVVQDKFLGDIPIFSPFHWGTEGFYGVQLTPLSKVTRYVITPATTFYEFLPREALEADNPRTVLAHQVEIGHEYELVVTTTLGLYRYRTNDIIRVVGRYNEAPMYEFIQRLGDNLDVYGEKTSASVIQGVIQSVFSKWNHLTPTDYTFTESVHVQRIMDAPSKKMHYVLFIEIHNDAELSPEEVDQDCCTRWRSAHAMLKRFPEQETAIRKVLSDDRKCSHLIPRYTDIQVLEAIKFAFDPVADLTDILSAEKYVTFSAVQPLLKLLETTILDTTDDAQAMASRLKEKIQNYLFKKYSDIAAFELTSFATYVDPRFKTDCLSAAECTRMRKRITTDKDMHATIKDDSTAHTSDEPMPRKRSLAALFSKYGKYANIPAGQYVHSYSNHIMQIKRRIFFRPS